MFSCQHMPDAGPCKAYIEQFYFNAQTGFCQVFIYGGCEGNPNRFNSRDECERTCASYRRKIIRNNAKQKWIR